MKKNSTKPFYFQPPWNILFDLQVLERVSPWEINLSFLLLSFLEEMEKRAEIDFRASGVALDSSATIYLMKSQLLLKLEEPPSPPEPKPDFIPPPLILPLRYELTTTTVQNLLEALDKALKTERLFTLKAPLKGVLPPPPEVLPSISAYLMEMEEQMERLLRKIRSLAEDGKVIAFSSIVQGLEKLQQIRTFIILLFLAHKGKVKLWQEENSDEMFITPSMEANR
jgi:chromatin segregation and condensation protein Rec8/ScpA/Scc1 (kleisin family)